MADYNLKAEITADASGYEAGVKKAEKASKKLSTTISGVIQGLGKSGLVGALGAVGLASAGLSATLGTVAKIAKKVSQTIDECSQAYRKQYQAEIALTTAVNNNPYVDGTATKRLKEFASEMQRVSDIGDEELLPMMADLIAKGRTEDETMQIMSVALDMSAGGAMSLDTAITQLNATLNGNVGRLGQQNAELKNLTEEELKQGKAVEILGAKYKGLAQATADSQKQLKNAVGDLKENLGQIFETALAPMRKYFTEVITNLNNAISKARDYKKAIKEVYGENGEISPEAEETAMQIIVEKNKIRLAEIREERAQLKLYGETFREDINELNKEYTTLQANTNKLEKKIREKQAQRKQQEEQARAEEEAEKKRIQLAEEQAKNEKELSELKTRQASLEQEWQDKLFNQRIEQLERIRDKELENEELTEEQKNDIRNFYMNQIVIMKVAQLEKERDEILKNEELTEDARNAVQLFYSNKIQNVKEDEAKKIVKIKEEEAEAEEEVEEEKANNIINIVLGVTVRIQEATKKMGETFKKVASKIFSVMKDAFSKIKNISSKLFSFNINDALDNLLKFEDSVLTFFVETLPKLPSFFASAIQSIIVLLNTVLSSIDWDQIQEFINSIIDLFIENAPTIVENVLNLIINIAQTVLNGLIHFVESGGWKMILDMLLTIQKRLEQFVTDNIEQVVNTIIAMLPDLIDTLIASIVSASQTLAKLIKPILKLIVKLIEAIIEVAFSDEVLDASMEVIESFIESIIDILIKDLPKMLPRLIAKVIKFILSSIPKATVAIVKGTVKAFSTTNWGQVIWDCFQGFIDAFKELFGIHSPSTVFEGFGKNMIEGLWNGINETGTWLINNIKSFFSGIADNIGGTIGNIFNGVSNVFSNIWDNLVNGAIWAVDGIKNAFNGITGTISNIWNNMTSGASQAVEGIKNVFNGIADSVNSAFGNIGNSIKWAINGVIDNVNSAINSVNSVVGWTGIRLATIQKLANGTDNARKGLTLVGEAGPELVYFNGGEQVLNNRNTNKALAEIGSGKSITNNITFNNTKDTTAFAMMSQLRQYNRQLAINGIL